MCPLGNDGEVSYGGTASDCGGRTRPIRSLPAIVISSEPAAPMASSSAGVQRRHHQHSSAAATITIGVMYVVLPRSV